ncbi:hypothetical protein E2493_05800 [Sphingomonas parva]|uniref:Uncharacterized protein n=1 Tax=Sphingomonas parva TaxID=2555898 RepID=A0A4Y8ZX44_9SPHN|nr:hypothetical protein [Sphingomonas parva]TFI59349.1 hypothetical protein E2493_05800 [Sphingomonas parva]
MRNRTTGRVVAAAAFAAMIAGCAGGLDDPRPSCLATCGEPPAEIPPPVPNPAAEALATTAGWRQMIRYEPRTDREAGASLWINEEAIIGDGAPRETGRKPVRELWINHGAARVAGQAITLQLNTYNCGSEGGMRRGPTAAFTEDLRQLAFVDRIGEVEPVLPHSAEIDIARVLCTSNVLAKRGRTAATVAEVIAAEAPQPAATEPAQSLAADLDADGKAERLSVHMRPHSMRLDVEIVFGAEGKAPVNLIAVEQPPSGPLVEAKLRAAAPNAYLYACEREENRDAAPCAPGEAKAFRGGVEIVTPGQPSLLLWIDDGRPRIVRLPTAG